jgi:hypothetical protein
MSTETQPTVKDITEKKNEYIQDITKQVLELTTLNLDNNILTTITYKGPILNTVHNIVTRIKKSKSETDWIRTKFNSIQDQSQRINLFKQYLEKVATEQGFKPINSVQDFNLLSNDYDNVTRGNEQINTIVSAVSIGTITSSAIGTAVAAGVITAVSVAIPPVGITIAAVAMFCVLGRCCTTFSGRYSKSAELIYIVSACLGFSTSIITLTGKMAPFYALINKILVQTKSDPGFKNYEPASVYPVTIGNTTYSFTGKTLQNLETAIVKSGAWTTVDVCSYKFLYFLMKTIDFTTNNLGEQQYMFWASLLTQVSFKEHHFTSDDENSRKYTFKYSKDYCAKMNDLITQKYNGKDNLKVPNINKNTNDDTNFMCLNMNDFIMDQLKSKVIKCLNTTSSGLGYSLTTQAIEILNNNKGKMEEDKIQKLIEVAFTKVFTDKYFGNIEKTTSFQSTDVLQKPLYIIGKTNFITQLARISIELYETDQLSAPSVFGRAKIKKINAGYRKPSYNNKYTKRHRNQKTNLSKTAKNQYGGGLGIPSPMRRFYSVMTQPLDQQYREMLREYTILTANFTLINNEYMMHYNYATRNLVTNDNDKKGFIEIFNAFETENLVSINKLNFTIKEVETDIIKSDTYLDEDDSTKFFPNN